MWLFDFMSVHKKVSLIFLLGFSQRTLRVSGRLFYDRQTMCISLNL